MKKILVTAGAMLTVLSGIQTANAAGEKDLQLIGRALSFVENGKTGDVTFAIVYSDDVAGSKTVAEGLQSEIGSGLTAGKVTLKPKLVTLTEVAGLPSDTALFVPGGMSAHYSALAASPAFTVSDDKACAEAGACVVAVQSAPSVEIYVSKSASEKRSVGFASAFRMMIKEL